MLGLAAVPSFILFVGCIFLPESPRWLVKHNHLDGARKVLKKLRGTIHIEEEVQEIITICQEEETLGMSGMFEYSHKLMKNMHGRQLHMGLYSLIVVDTGSPYQQHEYLNRKTCMSMQGWIQLKF